MAITKKKPASSSSSHSAREAKPPRNRDRDRDSDNGGMSKAEAFDNAKPQGQTEGGKYEAVLTAFIMQDENDKGQAARAEYEIATQGEAQGNRLVQFYSLFDADGNVAKGVDYLKRDLAILGKGDVRFKELEDAFEELTDEKPGVNVTVKQNGQYTNVYLNSICEEDLIEDYKRENKL